MEFRIERSKLIERIKGKIDIINMSKIPRVSTMMPSVEGCGRSLASYDGVSISCQSVFSFGFHAINIHKYGVSINELESYLKRLRSIESDFVMLSEDEADKLSSLEIDDYWEWHESRLLPDYDAAWLSYSLKSFEDEDVFRFSMGRGLTRMARTKFSAKIDKEVAHDSECDTPSKNLFPSLITENLEFIAAFILFVVLIALT